MQHDRKGGKLSGEVEVDESYIGGKARNMHKSHKAKKLEGKGGAWRERSQFKEYLNVADTCAPMY